MKITWFGNNVFRLYVGGQIIVTDPLKAPAGIEPHELSAGADVLIDVDTVLPDLTKFTKEHWRRGRPKSLLEEQNATSAPVLCTIDGNALILDSPDEPRLIVGFGPIEWDRFADDSVIVLTQIDVAQFVLNVARPKLIALAMADVSDEQFKTLATDCGDCALQVLEPGFALEA